MVPTASPLIKTAGHAQASGFPKKVQKPIEPVAVQYPCIDLTHEPEIDAVVGPPKTNSSIHASRKVPEAIMFVPSLPLPLLRPRLALLVSSILLVYSH